MKRLPRVVKDCLQKARDSALLAVEVYNKPAITFKSAAYITLMTIAWTSLFHAIFFRRKIKPYYHRDKKNPKSRYEKVDGDYKHWELGECLKQYYVIDVNNAVRKNLEFFIPLRNKIEHRSLPELDASIFGECQSMLLNFDDLLGKEFGDKCRIRQSLSFALQMYPSAENLAEAVKRNRASRAAADFIEHYRSLISADILQSGQYSFKAFLIQVANHPSKDALAIQFVSYDKLTSEQKKGIEPLVALVKYKHVPISNEGTMNAGQVAVRVQKALGDPKVNRGGIERDKFGIGWHTRCWQQFRVRPQSRSSHPEQTETKYCIYDRRHNDYGYTDEWAKFLAEKFKDDKAYEELSSAKKESKA